MLVRGKAALEHAYREGCAVGAFSVYNLEGAQAVRRAAEAEEKPAIIQAGSSAFKYAGRKPLAALALAVAEESGASVGVHLDHSRDLAEIGECLDLGYTSVMVDGSKLPFEANVALTKEAVLLAHKSGAWIEAELGGLFGNEDRSGDGEAGEPMTDPEEAARFVEETGVDALAIAIGNVHGFVPYEVDLDLERLVEIRKLVTVPLVLHGASGLPEGQIEEAIALGVAKINVNAELRRAFIAGVKQAAEILPPEDDGIIGLLSPAAERMEAVVREKVRFFARERGTVQPEISSGDAGGRS
jgi:ketose-bisphosphate aldolase